MLFKMAALFLVAATTKMETSGSKTQWVYESGPNKGYVCAVMEQDGNKYDVFLPSFTAVPTIPTVKELSPVPWLHFADKTIAESAVKQYCK